MKPRQRSSSAKQLRLDTIEMEATFAASDDITTISTSQQIAFQSELWQRRKIEQDKPKESPVEDDGSEVDELEADLINTHHEKIYLDKENNLHLHGWQETDGHDYVFSLTKPILAFKTKKWKIYQTYIRANAYSTVSIKVKKRLIAVNNKHTYKSRFDVLIELPEKDASLHVHEYSDNEACKRMYIILKTTRKKQQDWYKDHPQDAVSVILAQKLKQLIDEKTKKFW